MERHQGGLPRAERKKGQKDADHEIVSVACQDAAGAEIQCSGEVVRPDDGGQQKTYRRGQQDPEVDPTGAHRFFSAMVSDQRVGRQRQYFVKDEDGQQVGGKRDAQCRRDRHRETRVEARLIHLVVASHVADGVDRGDDPQAGGDEAEEHAERLDLEGKPQPRHHLDDMGLGPSAGLNFRHQRHDEAEKNRCRCQAGGLAEIRAAPQQHHDEGADEGQADRDQDGGRGAHEALPSSDSAAIRAMPAVSSVLSPKYTIAATKTHIGMSKESGASPIVPSPSTAGAG